MNFLNVLFKHMQNSRKEEASSIFPDLQGNPMFFFDQSRNEFYVKQRKPQTGEVETLKYTLSKEPVATVSTPNYGEMIEELMAYNKCDRELADRNVQRSIVTQEEVVATKRLIQSLKQTGYKLYVLSNMSKEFIEFLREQEVYSNFEGEVVSCEEHIVKPDAEIYRCLTSRYGLDVAETLFIDDRQQNVDAARNEGWQGFKFDPRNPEASCNELRDILLKK